MFTGLTCYQDAKHVTCYADADAVLAKASRTPGGRQRIEKPDGFHLGANRNHGVTWVRKDEDGNIGFTLYATQVVTWCPDDSVLIDNFGTLTTSDFARRFLPGGIHLHYPVERRGECGGDKGISYAADGGWHICHGGIVRFARDDKTGHFLPDVTTCDPIDLPVLDKAGTRAALAGLNLKDFALWLPAAARHLDMQHDEWDLHDCVEALKVRDFRTAAEHLPLIVPGRGFGLEARVEACALPIATRRGEYVTMGSIDKLKLAIYENACLFKTERAHTVDSGTFRQRMRRVRSLAALGCDGGWGLV